MDRTQEFFGYLAFESKPTFSRVPQATKEEQKFIDATNEIRSRLTHVQTTMQTFVQHIHRMDSLDECSEQTISMMVSQIQVGMAEIDGKIRALDNLKSRPPNASLVIQTLRQNLFSIGNEFKTADNERKDKIEESRRRRRAICGRSNFGTFDVTYDPEDPNANYREVSQIMETAQQERYETTLSVERAIAEIGQMFVQIHDLIQTQSYDLMRIDQHTESILANFEAGKRELSKYYDKVKSNKGLLLKIGCILFIFILVFIVVV